MASTVVPAADSALPVPGSLKQAADLARKAGEPLVILVSLPGCPYCELVRRNYLLPMRNEGVHAYQIDVTDSRKVVRGFDEVATTGAQLAERWNATFTPTVLFFDSRGQEIAGRLKGVASPDFYGSYLDDALAQARKTFAGRS